MIWQRPHRGRLRILKWLDLLKEHFCWWVGTNLLSTWGPRWIWGCGVALAGPSLRGAGLGGALSQARSFKQSFAGHGAPIVPQSHQGQGSTGAVSHVHPGRSQQWSGACSPIPSAPPSWIPTGFLYQGLSLPSGTSGHAESLWQTSGAAKAFGYFAHFINKCVPMPTTWKRLPGNRSGSALWGVLWLDRGDTGETGRVLGLEERQAARWPDVGHLGASKSLWSL